MRVPLLWLLTSPWYGYARLMLLKSTKILALRGIRTCHLVDIARYNSPYDHQDQHNNRQSVIIRVPYVVMLLRYKIMLCGYDMLGMGDSMIIIFVYHNCANVVHKFKCYMFCAEECDCQC